MTFLRPAPSILMLLLLIPVYLVMWAAVHFFRVSQGEHVARRLGGDSVFSYKALSNLGRDLLIVVCVVVVLFLILISIAAVV